MTIRELNTLRCKKQPLQTQAKTLITGSFSEDTLSTHNFQAFGDAVSNEGVVESPLPLQKIRGK